MGSYGRSFGMDFAAALVAGMSMPAIHYQQPVRRPRRRAKVFKDLNRSRHWTPADSYRDARRMAPAPSNLSPIR